MDSVVLKSLPVCSRLFALAANTRREIDYHLDILRATNGGHVEVYEGLPASPERLKLELAALYKLGCRVLCCRISSSVFIESWWLLAHSTLIRALALSAQTNPSIKHPSPENCLSVIQPILLKAQYLKKENLYEPFLFVCCSLCWLLLVSGQVDKSKNLSLTLARLFQINIFKESSEEKVNNREANLKDVVYLTIAISSLTNPAQALEYLNNIHCSTWQHTITYFKVCLLHDSNNDSEALKLATPLAQDKYKELEKKLGPQLCTVVGSCLSKSGMHHLAIDWFCKALTEGPTWTVPLWHIANEYFALKKPGPECSALKLLAQAAKATEENSNKISEGSEKKSPQLRFQEALYLLSSRLNHSGFHEEAFVHYKELFRLFPTLEDSEWILVARPSLAQLHLEIADAALHSEHFQECVEFCNTHLVDSPEQGAEVICGPSRDLLDFCDENDSYPAVTGRRISRFINASASVIKAVACHHLMKDEEAISLFKSVLSVSTFLESEEPASKRPRMESCDQSDTEYETYLKHWRRLISQCYSNLAVLKLRRSLKNDALHSLRVALIAWSDNLDALHNYILLLLQLYKKVEAVQTWKDAKDRTLATALSQDDPYWTFNVTQEALRNLDTILTIEPF